MFVLAFLAIGILLSLADFNELLTAFLALDMRIFAFTILLQIGTIYLLNWQWKVSAFAVGVKVSKIKLFYVSMTATFVESVMPLFKVGSELARVQLLHEHTKMTYKQAISMIVLQKTISFFSFMLLNLIVLALLLGFYFREIRNTGFFVFVMLVFVSTAIVFTVFMNNPRLPGKLISFLPFISKNLQIKLDDFFVSLKEIYLDLLKKKKLFCFMIVQAGLIWLIYAVKAFIIVRALGWDLNFVKIASSTLFSYMIAMVPIFPGGIGSFEAAFVFMFFSLGFTYKQGMVTAIVLRIVTFWFVFLVSAVYILSYRGLKILKTFNRNQIIPNKEKKSA